MNWYKKAQMPEGWEKEALSHLREAILAHFVPVPNPKEVSMQRSGEFFVETGREWFFREDQSKDGIGSVRTHPWYLGNRHTIHIKWKQDFSLYDAAVLIRDTIGYVSASTPFELLNNAENTIRGFYKEPGDEHDDTEPEFDPPSSPEDIISPAEKQYELV